MKVFYHGSVNKKLSELRPRNGRLFASPDPRVASIFLAGAKRACCRPVKDRIFAFIGDDREALLARDCGGSIYVLSGESFMPVPGGNPSLEWCTTRTLTPIMSFTYEYSIAAIIAFGVELYFVGMRILDQIEAADRTGSLIGSDVFKAVLAKGSENKALRALLLRHDLTLGREQCPADGLSSKSERDYPHAI